MTRNTRLFSDIDLNFTKNEVTGDIYKKYDEAAIKQSLKNLLFTSNYERPFHPEIGSQLRKLLFEPISPLLQGMLEAEITNTVLNFEPRVKLLKVEVRLNPDNNLVIVIIIFRIVNTEKPLTVEFTLQRTR